MGGGLDRGADGGGGCASDSAGAQVQYPNSVVLFSDLLPFII